MGTVNAVVPCSQVGAELSQGSQRSWLWGWWGQQRLSSLSVCKALVVEGVDLRAELWRGSRAEP